MVLALPLRQYEGALTVRSMTQPFLRILVVLMVVGVCATTICSAEPNMVFSALKLDLYSSVMKNCSIKFGWGCKFLPLLAFQRYMATHS